MLDIRPFNGVDGGLETSPVLPHIFATVNTGKNITWKKTRAWKSALNWLKVNDEHAFSCTQFVLYTQSRDVYVYTRPRKNTQPEPESRAEKNAFPYLPLRVNQMRREKKMCRSKATWQPVKFYSIASLHCRAVFSVWWGPTAFRTMALLCVLFIFYVHNEQSAICIYSQFRSRLPTFICCSLYSSSSSATSFWLCVTLKARVLLFPCTKATVWT